MKRIVLMLALGLVVSLALGSWVVDKHAVATPAPSGQVALLTTEGASQPSGPPVEGVADWERAEANPSAHWHEDAGHHVIPNPLSVRDGLHEIFPAAARALGSPTGCTPNRIRQRR